MTAVGTNETQRQTHARNPTTALTADVAPLPMAPPQFLTKEQQHYITETADCSDSHNHRYCVGKAGKLGLGPELGGQVPKVHAHPKMVLSQRCFSITFPSPSWFSVCLVSSQNSIAVVYVGRDKAVASGLKLKSPRLCENFSIVIITLWQTSLRSRAPRLPSSLFMWMSLLNHSHCSQQRER